MWYMHVMVSVHCIKPAFTPAVWGVPNPGARQSGDKLIYMHASMYAGTPKHKLASECTVARWLSSSITGVAF